ncbi:DUF6438 domain-containing protein [Sphingomonas sp. MS122]|uniref:DUF6438 domain-containing protein n=1 Tax=Sphingomonas sp. MS122 TaxID=3412683 RepID=UPI003C300AD3
MRRLVAVMLLGVAVTGCRGIIPERGGAAAGAGPASAPAREAITAIEYEAGPCFGKCPVYSFSVSSDGAGTFIGLHNTQVSGERDFRLTPAEFEAFAAALAPYRPAPATERSYAPGRPECPMGATDLPSVSVRWEYADARTSQLRYNFGCNGEANRAMADALGNAPDLIPALAPLIGARP